MKLEYRIAHCAAVSNLTAAAVDPIDDKAESEDSFTIDEVKHSNLQELSQDFKILGCPFKNC